jgi:lipoprotein-releasing system ATP-binding protein
MNDIILETHGLKKQFIAPDGETLDIVKGIDFSISKGDTVSIIGSSGAGKTTFLHLIGLLEHPTEGIVRYFNKDVNSLREEDKSIFRNSNIGFVFQMHYLLPEFTALENAIMPLIIRGESMGCAKEKGTVLFEKVKLSHRLEHKPGQLSGGEQQKVALIRAFIGGPAIILADEPTGNLDKKNALLIADLFLALNEEQKTALVIVTHNEALAAMMSVRYKIDDGIMVRL